MPTPTERINEILAENDRIYGHLKSMVDDLSMTLKISPDLLAATVYHWTTMPLPNRETSVAERVRQEYTSKDNIRRRLTRNRGE